MKRKLFLMIGLAALLGSCQTDVNELDITHHSPLVIKLDGEICPNTRVDDNGFCDGDQIGLYGVNYTANNTVQGELLDNGNQVDNACYTYNGEAREWQSSAAIYYKDAETNIDLYAYYPYASVSNVREYLFEVARDQSGADAADGFSASDLLWGKTENVVPSEERVKIRFSHLLSCANVVLTPGEGFTAEEFAALKKSVLVMNTSRTAEVDLSVGEALVTGEAEREGIVMKSTDDGFRAIVVPQSVKAGDALFTITIDGINYRFKKDEEFSYLIGKQHKFTIEVKKKVLTGTYEFTLTDCDIEEWTSDLKAYVGEARQYYVVHLDEAGTLGDKIREAQKNPAKIKSLKVSGNISSYDFDFMRDSMTILQSINLKESKIVGDPNVWCWSGYIDGEWRNIGFTTEYPDSWEAAKREVEALFPGSSIDYNNYYRNESYGTGADEIPYGAFDRKISLVNFVFPEKVTKIGVGAFAGTLLSGALIIPDDVVEIGYHAFTGSNISSLQLPAGIKVLGMEAFSNCSSISGSLVLPESLESIGRYCFSGCSMFSGNLILPSKLKTIEEYCFKGCGFTGDLIIPEGVTSIGDWAFYNCINFNGRLTLPSTLKTVGSCAFWCCGFQGELVIPKQLNTIENDCFKNNNFSSIIFEKDSELIKIGEYAFYYNWRVSEPLELPEGLMSIGSGAFTACSNIPSVTIPSTITTIGNDAFGGCYYITSMRCDATMPPVVGSGAFDGIGKDNLTLQVPESSVSSYQTATGWSDFKRISAYKDFSISRKHIRTLNAEHSKSYLLRAPQGKAWSVESCPEWVTVTPSSGVGRCEVTVTVSSMEPDEVATFVSESMDTWGNWETEEFAGRGGDIVFSLDDNSNYKVSMAVEQYDYEYGDGDVIVNHSAEVGGGVNIVFMGDCFDARDIAKGSYLNGINEAIGYYFGIEPYKTYKPYFNIYTVVGMSTDSGMGTVNTIKDAKFGSQYSLDGISPDHATCYEYAMKASTVTENNLSQTLVVLIENTTDYGGICYMWGDGSAIACCPMSRDAYPFNFRGIVQHEAGGHGFAKLADEYIYTNGFIESCSCPNPHLDKFYAGKEFGWYRNLSTNSDFHTVEWAHLFANPDYSNIVDMYEGGYFHTRGIFRSEANSCMNNNVPYYSAISRQEMVERIKRYAGEQFDINDFYAKDVRDASNNDFVTSSQFSASEPTIANMRSAGKQLAPKFMGDKPQLKNSNK